MGLSVSSELYKITKSLRDLHSKGVGKRELNHAKLNFDAKYISDQNFPLEFRVKAYLEYKKELGATIDILVKRTKSKTYFEVMKLVNTDIQITSERKHVSGGFCNCNDLSKRPCTTRYLLKRYAK